MMSGLLDELAQIKDPEGAASEEDVAQSAAASAYAGVFCSLLRSISLNVACSSGNGYGRPAQLLSLHQ